MLNVITLIIILLGADMVSVTMLSVILLYVIMLSVVMLSVIMLSVVMLIVVAPYLLPAAFFEQQLRGNFLLRNFLVPRTFLYHFFVAKVARISHNFQQ